VGVLGRAIKNVQIVPMGGTIWHLAVIQKGGHLAMWDKDLPNVSLAHVQVRLSVYGDSKMSTSLPLHERGGEEEAIR
jgi:hypothetical protein